LDTQFKKKEIAENRSKESAENLSPRGISSMQGNEMTAPQTDSGKVDAGRIPAEATPKVDTTTPPEFQPTPMVADNLEKGTADRVETGAEKKRDSIPAYGQGGPERGG
jgi:hypothetical protein